MSTNCNIKKKTLEEWIIPTNQQQQSHVSIPLCIHKATDSIAFPHTTTFKTIQSQHVSVFDDGSNVTFIVSEMPDPCNKTVSTGKEYVITESMISFLAKRSPKFAAFVSQYAEADFSSKSKAIITRAVDTASSPKSTIPAALPFAQKIADIKFSELLNTEISEQDEDDVRKLLVQNRSGKLTKLADSMEFGMISLQSQFVKQSKDYNVVYLGVISCNKVKPSKQLKNC